MADKDRRERLSIEDVDAIRLDEVRVTTSAVRDYRRTHLSATPESAQEDIRDLLAEAVEAGTLYDTPTGYVRARVGRQISVMLSGDLRVVVALHDDSSERGPKKRKKVARDTDEFREMIDPTQIHIGDAALDVFAQECELTLDEAEAEFREALIEALQIGEVNEEPNRQRSGEKVFVITDHEFTYSIFPDAGMVFSCSPID